MQTVPMTKTSCPSQTTPGEGMRPVTRLSAGSGRQESVLGLRAAATGVARVSPRDPPTTISSLPVQTDEKPSRLPSGPAGRRRQLSVAGLYAAVPTGPSGELEAHTTISSPVHTTVAPPCTPRRRWRDRPPGTSSSGCTLPRAILLPDVLAPRVASPHEHLGSGPHRTWPEASHDGGRRQRLPGRSRARFFVGLRRPSDEDAGDSCHQSDDNDHGNDDRPGTSTPACPVGHRATRNPMRTVHSTTRSLPRATSSVIARAHSRHRDTP